GRLRDLARVDVGRIDQQVDEAPAPVYVTLRAAAPAGGELPLPVPPGALDDRPHLNSAGPRFIFATLTVIVYPLLLRRTARHKAAEAADAAASGPDPGPDGGEDGGPGDDGPEAGPGPGSGGGRGELATAADGR